MNPAIVCTIGTDHHQFGRLIDWLDEWLESHPQYQAATVMQHGQSKPSRLARNRPFIAWHELVELMANCRVVITHAGPASLFEARDGGHLPICVPRDPGLDEIVDDHQQRFARFLGREGLVKVCETREDFHETLTRFIEEPTLQAITDDRARVDHAVDELRTVMAEFAARPTRHHRR